MTMKRAFLHTILWFVLGCILASNALPLVRPKQAAHRADVVVDVQKPNLPSEGEKESYEFLKIWGNKPPRPPKVQLLVSRQLFKDPDQVVTQFFPPVIHQPPKAVVKIPS